MRNCPVCESSNRSLLWRAKFLVIDGWTRPPYLDWMRCECGMIYGDHPDITQADYDKFYIERYGFGVTDAQALARLRQRAKDIFDMGISIRSTIVDFGGGDGGLSKFLYQFGYDNVHLVGCGDKVPEQCDLVIAEQVMEHIYDMPAAMRAISSSIKQGGYFIVDIPNASRIAWERPESMPMLDFTQVHINHFRVLDMLKLCNHYGFELITVRDYFERNCTCSNFVFVKRSNMVSKCSRDYVIHNISEKVKKLKEIGNQKVIVWGLGDIALHCMALQPLNVDHYVDIDPAMRGQTLQGIPIFDSPHGDYPIVVNVQSQKSGLLDYIKSKGYTNKVIVI